MVTGGLVNHIGIASESKQITFDDISTVAAAVAKQVSRDFGPVWGIQATVQAFASLEAIPSDYWQVILVDSDGMPGVSGYHTDTHGQPMSVVQVDGAWPVTVSHEILEQLADPFGNRIVSAELLHQGQSAGVQKIIGTPARVDYLVEVCDPVEALTYEINGVPVADFVLPSFYTSAAQGYFSDFLQEVTGLEISDGGYISFCDPATRWFQLFMDSGILTAQSVSMVIVASLRESMDGFARQKRRDRTRAAKPWRWTNIGQTIPGSDRGARTRAWLRSMIRTSGK